MLGNNILEKNAEKRYCSVMITSILYYGSAPGSPVIHYLPSLLSYIRVDEQSASLSLFSTYPQIFHIASGLSIVSLLHQVAGMCRASTHISSEYSKG